MFSRFTEIQSSNFGMNFHIIVNVIPNQVFINKRERAIYEIQLSKEI